MSSIVKPPAPPPEPGRKLFDHASLGQQSLCLEMIKADKDRGNKNSLVNWTDPDGWSPLIVSIYGNHQTTAISLLENGADPSQSSRDKWSPCFVAALYHRLDALKALIKKGADINTETRGGWTPLMVAVYERGIDSVEILLAAGAEINHVAKSDGATALSLAARNKNKDLAKLLMKKGATIELAIRDMKGELVQELAAFLHPLVAEL